MSRIPVNLLFFLSLAPPLLATARNCHDSRFHYYDIQGFATEITVIRCRPKYVVAVHVKYYEKRNPYGLAWNCPCTDPFKLNSQYSVSQNKTIHPSFVYSFAKC